MQKILKAHGAKGSAISLPPILWCMNSWGGKTDANAFLKSIPVPVQMLFVNSWNPKWKRAVRRLLSMQQENFPKREKSGCNIL